MATLSDGERRRQQAQKGQKKALQGRRCPQCGRGNALSRDSYRQDGVIVWLGRHCRYCDYARGDWL